MCIIPCPLSTKTKTLSKSESLRLGRQIIFLWSWKSINQGLKTVTAALEKIQTSHYLRYFTTFPVEPVYMDCSHYGKSESHHSWKRYLWKLLFTLLSRSQRDRRYADQGKNNIIHETMVWQSVSMRVYFKC